MDKVAAGESLEVGGLTLAQTEELQEWCYSLESEEVPYADDFWAEQYATPEFDG